MYNNSIDKLIDIQLAERPRLLANCQNCQQKCVIIVIDFIFVTVA